MKEFIEIPFGAKNSELCGWEYTIPEGFVASIENGKIIVKKEDDRDEKIRKEILGYFQQFKNEELRGVNISDWIAWLEKQDPKKHEEELENAYKTADEVQYKRGYEDAVKEMEKQGEQKSQRMISAEAKEALYGKPNWSEEDDTALCDALWCCKQATSIAKDENDMGNAWYAERWLKSLKERMKGE